MTPQTFYAMFLSITLRRSILIGHMLEAVDWGNNYITVVIHYFRMVFNRKYITCEIYTI